MGHQHHFLSRLDRVALPHVELALTLYRDHGLVRYLLDCVKLPEGAPRVAISLDDPERGPFLVVTRDGRFVTCLGEGMRPGNLPIVPRGQLDALTARLSDLRGRMAAASALAGPKGHTAQLIERIFHAGPELSREEFVGISAFQPLLGLQFLSAYFHSVTELDDLRQTLLRIERPKPALTPLLRRYWDLFWAIGHLSVLAFMDGRALVGSLPAEIEEELGRLPISWGAVRQGMVPLALRGAWAVAKVGKTQLRPNKQAFDDARTPLRLVTTVAGLTALGVRHAKLRAEVRKALAAPKDLSNAFISEQLLDLLRCAADAAFEDTEEALALQRDFGARLVMALTRRLAPGDPLRFETADQVPEDLAMTLPLNHGPTLVDNPGGLVHLMVCLPWAARAEPERLFLPREFLRAVHDRWEPSDTMSLLKPLRDLYHPRVPAPRRAGPARKGPCPCGSGEKYKRCCEKRQANPG